jgi:hypothetical protein
MVTCSTSIDIANVTTELNKLKEFVVDASPVDLCKDAKQCQGDDCTLEDAATSIDIANVMIVIIAANMPLIFLFCISFTLVP